MESSSSCQVASTNDTPQKINRKVEAPAVADGVTQRAAVIVVTHVNDDDNAERADIPPVTESAADIACVAATSDLCASPSPDKSVFDVEVSVDRGSCSKM